MLLVERARHRTVDGYVERHHVIPRCMGGRDDADNLVALTPEEHYTAHLLLMKIFPENGALARAAVMMCADSPTTPRQNKAYGWVKRRLAEHSSERMKEWHQHNQHPMQGRKHTEETRAKIRAGWNGVRKEVFCFSTSTGKLIATYDSVGAASSAVGLHPQTIYSCIRVPGKRTAGGMSWSYENKSPGVICFSPDGKRVAWKLSHGDCKKRQAWRNARANTAVWKMADVIFVMINNKEQLISFAKSFGAGSQTVMKVAKRIQQGWNPLEDNEWKEWKHTT